MTRRFVHFVAPQADNKPSTHLSGSQSWDGKNRPTLPRCTAVLTSFYYLKVHLFSPPASLPLDSSSGLQLRDCDPNGAAQFKQAQLDLQANRLTKKVPQIGTKKPQNRFK